MFETRITVADVFSIQGYGCSAHELSDADETFVLHLREGYSPIYIKKYPLPLPVGRDNATSLYAMLGREAERFVSEGMGPVLGSTPQSSLERGICGNLYYQQVVACASGDRWWIARLNARMSDEDYYLLHWVGSRKYVDEIVCAIASFELLR